MAYNWQLLHDPQCGGNLTAEQVLEVAKAAGHSEEVAQQLARARADARLRAELPP